MLVVLRFLVVLDGFKKVREACSNVSSKDYVKRPPWYTHMQAVVRYMSFCQIVCLKQKT